MSTITERNQWVLESMADDPSTMSDGDKLRTLACWFDVYDRNPEAALSLWKDDASDEVQRDLWRMAKLLDKPYARPQ